MRRAVPCLLCVVVSHVLWFVGVLLLCVVCCVLGVGVVRRCLLSVVAEV